MSERLAFVVDVNKCTGCHACEMACQIANGLPATRSWREVRTFNELHVPGVELVHLSMACNHCREAPCLDQCPALAYHRDEQTGALLINDQACLGCGYCAWVCPYDAPRLDEDRGVMTKCNMCNDKVKSGGQPACVTSCPTEALTWRSLPDEALTQDVAGFAQAGTAPGIRVEPVAPGRRVPLQTTPPALPPWAALKSRLPARISLGHEWPLAVFTLIATVLVALLAADHWGGPHADWRLFLGSGVAGMALSASHLGRGRRAWRASLHIARSWLSREILLFTVFLALGTLALAEPPWLAAGPALRKVGVVLGILLLAVVDRVYGVGRIRGAVAWHSAHVLGTGLFLIAVLTDTELLTLTVGVLKAVAYVSRQAARRRERLAAPVGLTVPRLAFLAAGVSATYLGGTAAEATILILAGEIIDRALYYCELEIPTPASLQLDELADRPQAHGVFAEVQR